MQRIRCIAASCVALMLASSPAMSACFASYKAKQDDPLKLHFGVAEVSGPPCDLQTAAMDIEPRLLNADWTLLSVVEIVAEENLDEVQESAGAYFLRY